MTNPRLNKSAKSGCIFTGQDHAVSGLLTMSTSEARVRDIAQRALKVANLIVVDVITNKWCPLGFGFG